MSKWDKLEKELRRDLKPTTVEDGIYTTEVIVFKGALGDMATEWFTDKDWEDHRKHVKKLNKEGEYLKPEVIRFSMTHIPEFDTPILSNPKKPAESYRMTMLDFNK